MTKSIREVLSPLLMISYICGLKVAQFPAGDPKKWFSILYILLLWSLCNFILIYEVIPSVTHYSTLYHISSGINMFATFLSIAVGMYHKKTFKNCIKKLTIVDDTLEKLGIATNYHNLRIRTTWILLGWSWTIMLITCGQIRFLVDQYNYNIAKALCIPIIHNYYFYTNLIGNLTIASILGYIELKFDQINEYLGMLARGNKRKILQVWKHSLLLSHQSRSSETPSNKWMIWIIMHLYSELYKISREINSIFGTQMTFEMICCFAIIALGFQEIFNVILIKDYNGIIVAINKIYYIISVLFGIFTSIFRVLLINCIYEKISTKASAIENFINSISYSSYDIEIRENILQLLQMSRSPLKFYGLGCFQFGFKFLHQFTTSVATLLVILIQSYTDK